MLDEIREKALGGRVDKIHQPSRDTLILHLRSKDSRLKLLFAANPTAPRLHFTGSSPENPAEPPMFCMLLRKILADRQECRRILKEENVAVMCAYMLMHFIAGTGDPLDFLNP